MRYILSLSFVFFFNITFSQLKVEPIELTKTASKVESIPFHINSVSFDGITTDTIGIISNRNDLINYKIFLPKNKQAILLEFLKSNFQEDKKGVAITMNISQLEIIPSEINKVSASDSFKYKCEFLIISEGTLESIYSFNAKNLMGSFENSKEVTQNYISRALLASMKNFAKAFEKHPDWDERNKTRTDNVKVNVRHNQIKNLKDSMICQKGFKLKKNDYSINEKAKLNAIGQTSVILTYKAEAIEKNGKMQINISTFSFFAKNRSWVAKSAVVDEQWLDEQQIHFDLCTIYGIKLSKEMKSKDFSMGEYKSEMNTIYNLVYTEYVRIRKEFDDAYKLNPQAIKTWREKVNILLIELE